MDLNPILQPEFQEMGLWDFLLVDEGHTACGILVSEQDRTLCLLQWKHGVLTITTRKSQNLHQEAPHPQVPHHPDSYTHDKI